jgi:hypothetical protein
MEKNNDWAAKIAVNMRVIVLIGGAWPAMNH